MALIGDSAKTVISLKGVNNCLNMVKGLVSRLHSIVLSFIYLNSVLALERQSMSKRSFRTSPKYEQQEAAILAHFGITGITQVELYEKLMEKLHANMLLQKAGKLENAALLTSDIDCIHLVAVEQKNGFAYYCLFQKLATHNLVTPKKPNPRSPPVSKKLPSLNFCKSCKLQCSALQAYRNILAQSDEQDETEPMLEKPLTVNTTPTPTSKPKQQEPEQTLIPVMHWIPIMKSDGSKMCPCDGNFVYALSDCKKCDRARKSQCISLFYAAQKAQNQGGTSKAPNNYRPSES